MTQQTENHQHELDRVSSRMKLKLYTAITTKEQENSKLECRVQRETGAGVTSLRRRNSSNLRRKQWRTKLRMK